MVAMVSGMLSRRLQLAEWELEPVMKAFVILSASATASEDTDSVGCWVPPLSCQLCCSKIKRARASHIRNTGVDCARTAVPDRKITRGHSKIISPS